MPIITKVERNIDRTRDRLVAQMERLGTEKYQQRRDQKLSAALKEIGLRTKPVGGAAFVITKT